MGTISLGFTGLFLLTFLSATILPILSEAFLLAMLAKDFDPMTCLTIATIGNSLGGITNYGIGKLGNPKWLKKLGINELKLHKYNRNIAKYGSWLALLSWIPVIGDPLVIGLGFFRVSFTKVLLLLVLGKFLRYLLIVGFYL
jgi:membrane protein YqaA with SNARE-associated domain